MRFSEGPCNCVKGAYTLRQTEPARTAELTGIANDVEGIRSTFAVSEAIEAVLV